MLVQDRPEFVASLLSGVLDVKVPAFTEARLVESTLRDPTPEFHADAVVLFVDQQPVFGAVFEAQLSPHKRKPYTWPFYAVGSRARHECPFVVVVVTPDEATARWAARPIDLGAGNLFRVHVVGPDGVPEITDPEQALRDPPLAVLSAIAHGGGDPQLGARIADAASKAILALPEEHRLLYSMLVKSSLSEATRKAFEMLPTSALLELMDEKERRAWAKAKAEGQAEGKAEGVSNSILNILGQRGVPVSDSQRQQIVNSRDLETLNTWLSRALSVACVDDMFE